MNYGYNSLQIYEGLVMLGHPRQQVEIETKAIRLYVREKNKKDDKKIPKKNLDALLSKLNVPIQGKDLARHMDLFSGPF